MSATVKQRKPGRPATDHRGRLRKIECPVCGFIARASAAALRAAGVPVCGCGEPMQVPQLRDLERIDPDGFEQTIRRLSHREHTAAMRELGHEDAIVRKAPPRRSVQPQCAAPGCSKFRALGVKFCREHEELEALPF